VASPATSSRLVSPAVEEPFAGDAAYLASALDAAACGIAVVAPDGRITWCNSRFREMWSLPGELDASPDDAATRAWICGRLVEPGAFEGRAPGASPEGVSEDLLYIRDGRIFERSSRPQRLDGRVIGRVWTFTDLTAETAAGEESRRVAVELDDLYQNAPCGYHSLDANGVFVRVNNTELGWLGYTADELIGRKCLMDLMAPESRQTFATNLARFLEDGVAHDVEYELLRKDGTVLPVLVNATAVRDAQGRVVRSRSVMVDMTDRRRAEAAVRQREERERAFYDRTPVMLHSIDAEGRLLSVSDRWLQKMGYTRAEVLGRKSTCFLTPDSARLAETEVLPAYFRTGACADVPYQMVHKDGGLIDVLLSATAERDADGRIVRSIAVLIDVTERCRAEADLARHRAHLEELVTARTAELAAANHALEIFTATASHDLRAPLRAIGGYSRILLEDCAGALDARGRLLLERIEAASKRQAQLIEDLLRLSRVGRAAMTREKVDLSALVRDVLAELAGAEPGRAVCTEVEPDLVAEGDRALLRVLFDNLLRNAWKFTAGRSPAHISFSASSGPEGTVYQVRDDGAGFDMASKDRLFRPFERLHTQAQFEGTGIGLATVQRIVERHGGRVWAEGAVGVGATFSFTLAPGSFTLAPGSFRLAPG
jgi:PAS domain S-box-containing protein